MWLQACPVSSPALPPSVNDAKIQEFHRVRSLEKDILQKCRNLTHFHLFGGNLGENDVLTQYFCEISDSLAENAAFLQDWGAKLIRL